VNQPFEHTDQPAATQPARQAAAGGEQEAAATQISPELGGSGVPPAADKERESIPAHGPQGIQFVISVLVIVVFMITFVVQAFRVPSESMENTLLIGDFLLADKLHFADDGGIWHWLLPYRQIQRGDIIVFRYPVDPSQYFVKRVIGLPGDHIRLQNKWVFVNGVRLQERYVIHSALNFDLFRDDFPLHTGLSADVNRHWRTDLNHYLDNGELVVPANQYFVMGDNRDQSLDSRYWGFVPRGNIMGRPLLIYLSVNDGDDVRPGRSESDGKLFYSGQMLAHVLQFARWDRIFRRVL